MQISMVRFVQYSIIVMAMDEVFLAKIFQYLVIVLSAVFHEYAHGFMAFRLGDPTAKYEGRLTLNPLAHIDPVGTVALPLFLLFTAGGFIGWARPVPYNPYNLQGKYGSLKVALAGPATNLLIALGISLIIRFLALYPDIFKFASSFLDFLILIAYINIFLGLFNLIPLPPLDGSKIFADLFPNQWQIVMQMGFMGIFIALFIAMYLLPPLADFIFRVFVGARFY